MRASAADAQSTEDDLRKTLVSEVAELARDYMLLRQYQQELELTRESLASERETLRVVNVRYRVGLVTSSDVARTSTEVERLEASIPPLESSERQSIHAIGLLLGRDPASLYGELLPTRNLPVSLPSFQPGLPSELLRRRPDIREAERGLTAADERLKSQIAGLFPSITISAQFGGQSGQIQNLADAAARFFSYGPKVGWGLLSYPTAKQNVRIYDARRQQQFTNYQKTVLSAYRDVDDALAAFHADSARKPLLEAQLRDAETSLATSQSRYNNGLVDLLDVLEAQRSVNSTRDSLVQCEASLRADTIALYKALGGGWEANDPALVAQK